MVYLLAVFITLENQQLNLVIAALSYLSHYSYSRARSHTCLSLGVICANIFKLAIIYFDNDNFYLLIRNINNINLQKI
jgi:hypothetical protein